jgi:hypothetical protein
MVPRMPSWTKSWCRPSCPFAWSAAIRAQVPVPHGERSIAPVHVAGRSQSKSPVETTTAFLYAASGRVGGPHSWPIEMPTILSFSGWTTGNCSRAAVLTASQIRTISRPFSGAIDNPSCAASAMTYHIPPYATSTVTGPSVGTSMVASR